MNKELSFGFIIGAACIGLSRCLLEPATPLVKEQAITIDSDALVLNQLTKVQEEIQELKSEVSKINLNVDALHGKHTSISTQPFVEQEINEHVEEVSNVQDEGESLPLGETMKWQKDLSAELRQQMDEVFGNHHQKVRSRLEAAFGPLDPKNPIPPDELDEFMKGDQEELFAAMKLVLPEDKYEQFVKSFQ